MPRTKLSPEERLNRLRAQEAQLKAQIAKEAARVKGQERKDDTRRKIIAGALALEHASLDPDFGDRLNRLIFRHVTKPADRALFGLEPLKEGQEEPPLQLVNDSTG